MPKGFLPGPSASRGIGFMMLAAFVAAVAALAPPVSAQNASAQSGDSAETAAALALDGNETRGKRLFLRCKACHNLTDGRRHKLGPNLHALFGRKAGSLSDYRYSRALAEADFAWSRSQLNRWLKNPSGFLPGNKMSFAGLRTPQDRADLLAYLEKATEQAQKDSKATSEATLPKSEAPKNGQPDSGKP